MRNSGKVGHLGRTFFVGLLAASLASGLSFVQSASSLAAPAEQANTPPPDFSGGWASDNHFGLLQPASGPGPIGDLAGYFHFEFYLDANGEQQNGNLWIGNYNSPLLTPWASAILKPKAEAAIKGTDPFWASSLCWPGGVTSLVWAEPMFFLQTPSEVTIIYQRDHMVRHVYMNKPHSDHPVPSWYGESVGHYEGDVLVVDTIGFNDKTFVDRYGTPHSEELHVVERYRVTTGGKRLEGTITFEDPKAYTMKWSAAVRYDRTPRTLTESICAETPIDYLTGKMYPIPVADKPDF